MLIYLYYVSFVNAQKRNLIFHKDFRKIMKNSYTKNLVLSALFLALGFILPLLTGQIPTIGQVLLPMHIPVFLCALICGWKYGALIGVVLPLLRSFIFSVPTLYPTAIAVAFEMGVYGFSTGLLFELSKQKSIFSVYGSMLVAMVLGRIVRCVAEIILLGMQGNAFAWETFFLGVIVNALPGIILQLVLVPAVILLCKKTKLIDF